MVIRAVTHGTTYYEHCRDGVTPAELILNNSIRLSNRILAPGSANPTSQVALSDTMDNWVARQHTGKVGNKK